MDKDAYYAKTRHPLAFACGMRDFRPGMSSHPHMPKAYWPGSWMRAAWLAGWEQAWWNHASFSRSSA
jgi:hypothetical protein